MTNKPGNWRQGIAAFCRWGLAWLSIGLCTLLAGINLLRTAFMDMNRESSYQELVSYEADHPLRFLLFLAAALAVTLLLQRWWSTADAQRSRAVRTQRFFLHGVFLAFGGSGTSAWSLRRIRQTFCGRPAALLKMILPICTTGNICSAIRTSCL